MSCNPKLPKHMATWADSNRPALNQTEQLLFGSRALQPNVRMDFRENAPFCFTTLTRPRPVSVEVSEFRFAKMSLMTGLGGKGVDGWGGGGGGGRGACTLHHGIQNTGFRLTTVVYVRSTFSSSLRRPLILALAYPSTYFSHLYDVYVGGVGYLASENFSLLSL